MGVLSLTPAPVLCYLHTVKTNTTAPILNDVSLNFVSSASAVSEG